MRPDNKWPDATLSSRYTHAAHSSSPPPGQQRSRNVTIKRRTNPIGLLTRTTDQICLPPSFRMMALAGRMKRPFSHIQQIAEIAADRGLNLPDSEEAGSALANKSKIKAHTTIGSFLRHREPIRKGGNSDSLHQGDQTATESVWTCQ